MHTVRYLVKGIEVGRASAATLIAAKKIVAYSYLYSIGYIPRDKIMQAALGDA
ncbi:hypothetical protein H1R20_g6753, partial [Candolleomyces eurysporus]